MRVPDRKWSLIDWMRANPPSPRIGEYVMPYLVVLLTIVTIGTAVSVYKTRDIARDTANFAHESRTAQVYVCQHSGNRIRKIIRNLIYDQIHSQENIAPRFFPNIPPKELNALIHARLRHERAQLRAAHPVHCIGLYGGR